MTRPQYGPAIRQARLSRGWSQGRLARAMSRPGSRVLGQHVSGWEHDRPRASVETLFRIGGAMEYDVVITADGVRFVELGTVVLPPEGD